ncbi:TPA: NAD-dependent epimerase/dehydratase family protein, partial [Candidatus Bathyarchaeota archaeon]|nr:NAD-dependent epimerase/dehydratase family protein [Candidatus Bathyarchaeota archaeon]
MRVLVTGGAGFIGSHLTERLLGLGHRVTCVDNLSTSSLENIRHLLPSDGFSFVRRDVKEGLPSVECDVIYHLAARPSPVEYMTHPVETLKTNILGGLHVMEFARKRGCSVIFASSSEVYGSPDVFPTPEVYRGFVNPVGVRSCYDEGKRCVEALCAAYHRKYGVRSAILRIFNSVLPDQPVAVFNDGEFHLTEIGEYARTLRTKGGATQVFAPAFDPRTRKVDLYEVSAFIEHPYIGDVYTIETTYGRKVTVTGDHSVFTIDDSGEPVPVPARQLRVGDYVAVPARLPAIERDVQELNIGKELMRRLPDDELWCFAVSFPRLAEVIHERRGEIYRTLLASGRFHAKEKRSLWGRVCSYRKSASLPLYVVKRLGISIPPDATIRTYRGGRGRPMPNRIRVTNDLLWLIGLYLAEGSEIRIPKKDYGITISSNKDYLARAGLILERIFNAHVVTQKATKGKAPTIYAHSKLLYFVFDRIFNVLKKRVPAWVFQLPLRELKYILKGYCDGDGTHGGKSVGKILEFNTSSEGLALDITMLLLRFGVMAMVKRYDATFKRVYGDRRFAFFRISVRGLSTYNVLEWDKGVSQRLRMRRTGDIVWVRVRRITRRRMCTFVYDFSVFPVENFVAGWAVFCHNTYGPRMRIGDGRVIPTFICQALRGEPLTIHGDGEQTRSFCYISDLIDGMVRLMDVDSDLLVLNLGNP